MRVVFMGSPDFAIPSLRALAGAHEVVGVYTRADSVRGRGRKSVPTPVKVEAVALGLPVRTPLTLKDPDEQRAFADLAADVACVAAYGLILPRPILEAPRFGCVNVHASLLPRHRGAAPVHRAILEGDAVTGVSIMRMEEGLDTGPYATVCQVDVGDHDASSLTGVLAELGAKALLETLEAIEAGTVLWTPQNAAEATYAAKISDDDVILHPGLSIEQALRRVRVSGPSARSKARVCGTVLDVVSADRSDIAMPPGHALVDKSGVVLGFADGTLAAREVRPEGRATMSGTAFACGLRVDDAMTWESA